MRPVVPLALIREYVYAYAALSPVDGALDWMLAQKSDTHHMGAFLRHVSQRHPGEFVVMVIDGAPSHRAFGLEVPRTMGMVRLPPYSPELNPTEHLWDELREKDFANRVFGSLGAAMAQAAHGLDRFERSPEIVHSLSAWDWLLRSS